MSQSIKQNQKPIQGANSEAFDIHVKLKRHIAAGGCNYSYMHIAQPYQDGSNYEFITIFYPDINYLIYKRVGNYFCLVDFFLDYKDACCEAKGIIDSHADIRNIFVAQQ